MLVHYARDNVTEWIDFALVPNCECQRSTGFRNAKHLTHGSVRVGEKHHAQAAYNHVELCCRRMEASLPYTVEIERS